MPNLVSFSWPPTENVASLWKIPKTTFQEEVVKQKNPTSLSRNGVLKSPYHDLPPDKDDGKAFNLNEYYQIG